MITVESYFKESEHALISQFESLDYYNSIAKKSIEPTYIADTLGELKLLEKQQGQNLDSKKNMELYKSHMFSRHFLSGSILQFSSKAIELFSNQTSASFEKQECFPELSAKSLQFCVGRQDKGIPIGLIILAGRNQYNHIEAGQDLSKINKTVFKILSEYKAGNETYIDPCFDLSNDVYCYSSNIITFLGWENYSSFKKDMSAIFSIKI